MRRFIRDTRARQGRRGTPMLWVLGVSMALAVVAIIGYMMWVGRETPRVVETSPGPAVSEQAPLTSPTNPANPVPAVQDVNRPPAGQN